MNGRSKAMSQAGVAIVLLTLALAAVSIVYISSAQNEPGQLIDQNQEISQLKQQLQVLVRDEASLNTTVNNLAKNLPVVSQAPTIRTVRETWFLSSSAHQDRFDPSFIVVNQGDTVRLTLIDNDSVAHDFVVGPPYSITVNATVPGLVNDITGNVFTTYATDNSPGVIVKGSPGNVSAEYSFKAL